MNIHTHPEATEQDDGMTKTGNVRDRYLALALMAAFALLGVALGVLRAAEGAWGRGLLGFATPLFLLVPPLLQRWGIGRPHRLYAVLAAFCILAYDIGCVWQGFDRIPLLDKVVHTISGIVFTIAGFCVYHALARREQVGERLLLSCSYALFFSAFIAVGWETFEFMGYVLFGMDSQHHLTTGVFDTMLDMIGCMIGSFISVASFVFSARSGRDMLTAAVVRQFHDECR